MLKWFLLLSLVSANNIETLETSNELEDFLALRDMDAVMVTNTHDYKLINALSVAYPSLRLGHLKDGANGLFPPSTIRTYNTFKNVLEENEFDWTSLMELDYWLMNTTTPDIVEPSYPIFQVVYDYSEHHFISYGLDLKMVQRLSKIFKPKIIFIDVPIDNMLLVEKFNLTYPNPSAVLVKIEKDRLSFEHLKMDEGYIKDKLHAILSKKYLEL